jgi:uncharacterized repeat protein (TIGR03803 family)
MTNSARHQSWISGLCWRMAIAALASTAAFAPVIVAARLVAATHGGVILDKAGNLYGTTTDGGNNSGTVFKISKSGKQTILYKFPTSWQVGHPYAGLIQDEAEDLYGTASGQNPDVDCCGTVFKLTR